MPQTPGPRTGLAKLLTSPPSDPATIFRSTINSIIDWLEGNATLTSSGLLANRPVSTVGTPGISGRSYYATDLGVLFRDTGTGWVPTGAAIANTYANRPTPSADLNGVRFFATDKAMEWQCVASAWVLVAILAPEVTSLPASPIDQQECVYVADATNGVKWHLRYRAASASTYKWELIGAPPLNARIDTQETLPSGGVYADPTTPGPTVTAPLAGDYDVTFGLHGSVAGDQNVVRASPKVSAAAPNDLDGIVWQNVGTAAATHSATRTVRATIAAGQSVKLQYYGNTGGVVLRRWLQLRPVRVG